VIGRSDFGDAMAYRYFAEVGGAIFSGRRSCGAIAAGGYAEAAVCVDDVWDGGAACRDEKR